MAVRRQMDRLGFGDSTSIPPMCGGSSVLPCRCSRFDQPGLTTKQKRCGSVKDVVAIFVDSGKAKGIVNALNFVALTYQEMTTWKVLGYHASGKSLKRAGNLSVDPVLPWKPILAAFVPSRL